MNLRQLEMLLAVVQHGGYTNAGKALHVSHSSIHRQVRILEEELRCRVLERAGRHVEVTEAGRVLMRVAQQIELVIADARRQIADLDQLRSGALRIGSNTNVLIFFIAPVLKRFRKEHPQVDVSIMTNTADRLFEEIAAGGLAARGGIRRFRGGQDHVVYGLGRRKG